MAVLQNLSDGSRVRPATRCLVGRTPHCHMVLDDASISREHAVIFYERNAWCVRDFSSRNGTTLDAKPVKDTAQLALNSLLCFGSKSAWRLVDVEAPLVRGRSSSGEIATGLTRLFLPNADACEAFVSRQDGEWYVEINSEIRGVNDNEPLQLADGLWTLELTVGEDSTLAATAAIRHEETRLHFRVSPDEEHVELVLDHHGVSHTLGHRSHSYLLLVLARARLQDQTGSELSAAEHGWLETKHLARMLRTTSEQINLWIFRAREQIQRIDSQLAEMLVERRPTVGQLRIGLHALKVPQRAP